MASHRNGNRLPLPWRSSFDPWLILVSELLLDETPPARIGPAYDELRAIVPDPATTSSRARWVRGRLKAMGMAARADLVIELSRQIMRKHGGVVPEEDAELRTLPGVGDYIASTVRCLVFGARTVVLHESSRRIISRFTGRSADSNWTAQLELFLLAGPAGPDAEFESGSIGSRRGRLHRVGSQMRGVSARGSLHARCDAGFGAPSRMNSVPV